MAVVTQTMQDNVTELYLGFFGRAPDAAGFGYWTNRLAQGDVTIQQISKAFAKTPEFISTYDGLTPTQQVTKIYMNVLNRAPDAGGLAYWVGQLTSGAQTIDSVVWNVTNSAFIQTGTADGLLVQNKVTVGEYFAITLASNDTASAASAYNLVTSNPASVAQAEATLVTATYTLTTTPTTITGIQPGAVVYGIMSSGNDATLLSSDILSGTGGTLSARVTTAGANFSTAPVVTGLKDILISNVATGNGIATLNLASSSGQVNVGLRNSSGTTSVTEVLGVAAGTTLVMDNAKGQLDASIAGTRTGTANAQSFAVLNGTGTSTASAVVLMETAAGTQTADNTFNYLNITTGGAASYLDLRAGTGVSKVTVTGLAAANTSGYGLVLTDGTNAFSAVKTIDASGMTGTGGLSITINDTNVKTYIGSAQSDRLALSGGVAQLNTSDSITFGNGTDTLAFGNDTTVSAGAGYTTAKLNAINAITGLEVLEFTAANFGTIDAAASFTNVSAYKFSGAETAQTLLDYTGLNASAVSISANHAIAAAAGASGSNATGANASGANGAAGASAVAAIKFSASTAGSTEALKLSGGVTLQHDGGAGGLGGAASGSAAGGAGGAGGAGAAAVDFGTNVTKLIIDSSGTTANAIIGGAGGAGGNAGGAAAGTGGTAGAGGAGAAAILNGTAVQNVTITGTQDLTIQGNNGGAAGATAGATAGSAGAGAGANHQEGFSGAINVDATGFSGKLTINLSTGNDSLTLGSGGDVVRSMGGLDSITYGSGVDKFDLRGNAVAGTASADSTGNGTNLATITGFTSGTDKILVSTLPTLVKSGALFTATGTNNVSTDVGTAITAGGGFGGNSNAALITVTGGTDAGTYLAIDTNNNGAYNANTDAVIKLVGVTTVTAGDFATS